jgi:hypothetical protein
LDAVREAKTEILGKNLPKRRPIMTYRFASITICFAGLVLLPVPAAAGPIAMCNASFTECGIPENILLQLPFTAFAGDVIVTESGGAIASDVFRIFNNIVNTGGGTGLGNMVFLYSSDDTTLPSPSTYSANAVFIAEDPSGITSYLGNGTNYQLAVPEPQTFELLSLAAAAMAVLARRRSRTFQGDL